MAVAEARDCDLTLRGAAPPNIRPISAAGMIDKRQRCQHCSFRRNPATTGGRPGRALSRPWRSRLGDRFGDTPCVRRRSIGRSKSWQSDRRRPAIAAIEASP
jgi:hypothetical protein